MIRLTRRAWNNVLIISVLFMIFLFNSTNNILSDNAARNNEVQLLLAPDSPIMTIDFNSLKIERIGRGWRTKPTTDFSEDQLTAIVNAWRTAEVTAADALPNEAPLVVIVWLAGQSQGHVFELFDSEQGPVVRAGQRVFQVINHPYNQLAPKEVW